MPTKREQFRASYGTKLHYQRLALESRDAWVAISEKDGYDLFVPCGMLRVQPTETLGALEKETLANMQRDGLRDTQFVKSDAEDRKRAASLGWESKLLDFAIPDDAQNQSFEAVLDSLAGFTRCCGACAYYHKIAVSEGVEFRFGSEAGAFASLLEEKSALEPNRKKAVGLVTKDGQVHKSDVVVIAGGCQHQLYSSASSSGANLSIAGSFSTQLLPDLSYHLESSAGSIATFKIDKDDTELWDKYSPERFAVMTWKSAPRNKDGKDLGSVYVFPRTSSGIIKIGYRGVKASLCLFFCSQIHLTDLGISVHQLPACSRGYAFYAGRAVVRTASIGQVHIAGGGGS